MYRLDRQTISITRRRMTGDCCYSQSLNEYWPQVAESDGFDIENVSLPSSMHGMITGLIPYDCRDGNHYPYRMLVNLYAKVGLHRYNMLEGTSFELNTLMKFNMLQNCVSSFYMTLFADDRDPAASTLHKTFQVRVDEKSYGTLDLAVSIARRKGEVTTKKPLIPHFRVGPVNGEDMDFDAFLEAYDDWKNGKRFGIFKGELPDWPSDDDLNDGKRFYMVKESEWRDTDWIIMYLELVICANDRSRTDPPQRTNLLSQLEIMKVAIETASDDVEPSNERLKAKYANVYIMFKGMEKVRAPHWEFESGKDIERKAIVRRVIDEDTGYLTLLGKLCGGRYVKPRRPSYETEEKPESLNKRSRLD